MSEPSDGRKQRLADQSGFTLIEVLVALVVLSLMVSVLLRAVVGLRDDAKTVDLRTHAEMVAQAELEDAMANRTLRDGTYTGVRDGTRWQLTASFVDLTAQLPPPKPVDKPAGPQGADEPPAPQQQNDKPAWRTQRLVVQATTGRQPVEVETIRLVRVEQQAL